MDNYLEEEFEELFTKTSLPSPLVKAWEREKERLNMNDQELLDYLVGVEPMTGPTGKIFKLNIN